jgi:hypothetical protein
MLVVCLPSWFQALGGGQNTFISLLILTGFCALLMKGREGLAGVVLSLLAYKFYLIAVPGLVLLAKRRWRAVGGLALGGLLTLAVTALVFGTGAIVDYVQYAPSQGRLMEEAGFQTHKQHSWHGFFELIGAGWIPGESVRILAVTASLATLTLLLPIWHGRWDHRETAFPLKLAALMLATVLTSAHLLHYDVLLVALPAMLWLTGRGRRAQHELGGPRARTLQLGARGSEVVGIMVIGFCWLAVAEPVVRFTHLQLSPLLMLWWLIALARPFLVREPVAAAAVRAQGFTS